ncbi:hypothetical protein L1987_54483 [Smallanthus sonchifolius]|uniref:Uncharacterized protein n=1 Tax=Smallanthus sonchifolius TaxID=185202 RepID=A0ACB9E755_9ASTR|nr:hypothetical protein L1987_54483 [Smallanthus sonchifolius]
MFNRLPLKGIPRSNRGEKEERKKIELEMKNLEEGDKKMGLNFSDSDDDQTPLSLLVKKKKQKKGKEREVGDSSEVREVIPKELQTVTGKDLDHDFKEVEVEEKEMDTNIANAET